MTGTSIMTGYWVGGDTIHDLKKAHAGHVIKTFQKTMDVDIYVN